MATAQDNATLAQMGYNLFNRSLSLLVVVPTPVHSMDRLGIFLQQDGRSIFDCVMSMSSRMGRLFVSVNTTT